MDHGGNVVVSPQCTRSYHGWLAVHCSVWVEIVKHAARGHTLARSADTRLLYHISITNFTTNVGLTTEFCAYVASVLQYPQEYRPGAENEVGEPRDNVR